jgi:hypothetical protein
MIRKALAAVLVISWVVLAGIDLLEDLDVPIQAGLHNRAGGASSNFGQGANLADNIIESAHRPWEVETQLSEPKSTAAVTDVISFSKKAVSLHKLNRVFLI